MWVTIQLGDTPKETCKYVAHGPWKNIKGVGRQCCTKCGLIRLKNSLTRWCIDKGCDHDLHPNFKQQCKTERMSK